jgi:hypothetical protein
MQNIKSNNLFKILRTLNNVNNYKQTENRLTPGNLSNSITNKMLNLYNPLQIPRKSTIVVET